MKMNFVLQKINGEISFDFVLTTVNAINYLNWKGYNSKYEFIEIDEIEDISQDYKKVMYYKDCIPVGSVEFVEKYIGFIVLNKNENFILKPLNVPNELLNIGECERTNIKMRGSLIVKDINFTMDPDDIFFIKSNDEIKSKKNGFKKTKDIFELSDGNWQISRIINDIESEYRCFIYNDNLLDVRRYLGDFSRFPDVKKINDILLKYRWDNGNGTAPIAFTLDIALVKDKIEIIECHEFFSCGLYGFNDLEHLPFMIARTYNNIIKKIKH